MNFEYLANCPEYPSKKNRLTNSGFMNASYSHMSIKSTHVLGKRLLGKEEIFFKRNFFLYSLVRKRKLLNASFSCFFGSSKTSIIWHSSQRCRLRKNTKRKENIKYWQGFLKNMCLDILKWDIFSKLASLIRLFKNKL